MLRITWRSTALPPRLLTEAEFMDEFSDLDERHHAGLPSGPVAVEGLDAQHRVAWHAYYKSAAGLGTLLRQLRAEREISMCRNAWPHGQAEMRGALP